MTYLLGQRNVLFLFNCASLFLTLLFNSIRLLTKTLNNDNRRHPFLWNLVNTSVKGLKHVWFMNLFCSSTTSGIFSRRKITTFSAIFSSKLISLVIKSFLLKTIGNLRWTLRFSITNMWLRWTLDLTGRRWKAFRLSVVSWKCVITTRSNLTLSI